MGQRLFVATGIAAAGATKNFAVRVASVRDAANIKIEDAIESSNKTAQALGLSVSHRLQIVANELIQ